jgi:phosphoglycerate dehydrogenase-like enzyme
VITACVPSEAERDLLGAPAVIWNGAGSPPEGIEGVEFFVPPYMPSALDGAVLTAMPRLQVVQLLSAGFERWLPILPPGVVLCNGRGVHGASTAELAVGGLISILRELPRLLDQQRAHEWHPQMTEGLDGRRVLVLGSGDIGRRVATAVAAFGAVPTLVGRTAREDVRELGDLPALLPDQDAVVLALPLTPDTQHLVDAAFLAALPDGAILVNVARGPVVDTDALVAEVGSGRLRAFLDVTDPEPLPADHPLWGAPNVLISPHTGGGTLGWQERGYALIRDQYARFLAGEPLVNVVA